MASAPYNDTISTHNIIYLKISAVMTKDNISNIDQRCSAIDVLGNLGVGRWAFDRELHCCAFHHANNITHSMSRRQSEPERPRIDGARQPYLLAHRAGRCRTLSCENMSQNGHLLISRCRHDLVAHHKQTSPIIIMYMMPSDEKTAPWDQTNTVGKQVHIKTYW